MLKDLPEAGIGLVQPTRQLEDEGVTKVHQAFDTLMESLAIKGVTA